MESRTPSSPLKSDKNTMKKKLLIAGASVVGLLVVSVLGLALLFDANQFKPQLEQTMGEALGRKVTMGRIKIAPFSGGVAVKDLAVADDAAFSAAPFVTTRDVTVGVDLLPLIFLRSLRVQAIRLQNPEVVLLRSASGQWNFSGLGGAASTSSTGFGTAMSVSVNKITVDKGRILVRIARAGGKERVYENVNLEVNNLSLTSQFPFRVTATTPGGGTVALDGRAGPINASDAANTPFQATADIAHLDVKSTGFIDPASGLSALVDFRGTLVSDGSQLTSKGRARATSVQLVPAGLPTSVPIEVDYESEYIRKPQTGVVKGDVHIGKAVAYLTGNYNAAGEAIAVRMKLKGENMPAPDLEATLPAIGMRLPLGASLKRGTMDLNLAINGPADRLVIAGPVHASEMLVTGFDAAGKLGALSSLGGLSGSPRSGDTLIKTLDVTVSVAPSGIQATNVNVAIPTIGNLTGGGTISARGDLDFAMRAKLADSRFVGEVSRIFSLRQPAAGIPFRITGTTANPVFVPDVGRAAGDLVASPNTAQKAVDALGGLFGVKKR
jgi:AsmA protein